MTKPIVGAASNSIMGLCGLHREGIYEYPVQTNPNWKPPLVQKE